MALLLFFICSLYLPWWQKYILWTKALVTTRSGQCAVTSMNPTLCAINYSEMYFFLQVWKKAVKIRATLSELHHALCALMKVSDRWRLLKETRCRPEPFCTIASVSEFKGPSSRCTRVSLNPRPLLKASDETKLFEFVHTGEHSLHPPFNVFRAADSELPVSSAKQTQAASCRHQ